MRDATQDDRTNANSDEHVLTVCGLHTYTTKRGEEWWRVVATDGDQIEFLMTNLHLGRVALGDKIRVHVSVIEAPQP